MTTFYNIVQCTVACTVLDQSISAQCPSRCHNDATCTTWQKHDENALV